MDHRHLATLIALIDDYGFPSLASVRRDLFWSGLWIFTVATGLASMIFMAWAFYIETLGRGALFIEPNRYLAAGELATVSSGMVSLMILFLRALSRRS